MAGVTSPYGLPYQEVGDSPNGAVGLQNLAEAVDDALAVIDAKIATINSFDTAFAGSSTDESGFTNTTFAAGASPVGVAFTVPPSGKVAITFSAGFLQNINTFVTIISCEVKTGGTVGSGTLAGAAANGDRALVCGRAVNSGAVAQMQASRRVLYTGLTVGATYNVRIMHAVDGGSGTITYREVMVEPLL